ncbi:hypothetical protein FVE85_2904 [Porphyridium purpureum]|uniref:Nucleotide exchange factor Fes1 domain-containing protein n=1 Tax=Porphyridium purpureum TaxID=35688 RepID=A0A5J4YV75_PORPP|nr:hypothetical protein FVE85_2904 [Porphyridium purpureum]|eukprot:POR4261..scf227_4
MMVRLVLAVWVALVAGLYGRAVCAQKDAGTAVPAVVAVSDAVGNGYGFGAGPAAAQSEEALSVMREVQSAEAEAVREVRQEGERNELELAAHELYDDEPRIRSMNDLLNWALSHNSPPRELEADAALHEHGHEHLRTNATGAAYQASPSKVEAFYEALDSLESETQIMKEAIRTLRDAPEKDALVTLDVLEDLCHQIDNAVFLSSTGGFRTLQSYLQRPESEKLSASVALTLASCAQNNPQVITELVDLDVLSDLVTLLLRGTLQVKARMLLLCAAILDFPYAHEQVPHTVRRLIPMSIQLVETFGARSNDIAAERVVRRSLDVVRLILQHQPEMQLESRDQGVVKELLTLSTSKAVQESAAELALIFAQ